MTVRIDTYDDDENIRLHRIGWRMQYGFYALLTAALIAGILGLFGTGIFSEVDKELAPGLHVRYERFTRADSKTYVILYASASAKEVPLTLSVPSTFYQHYALESMEPLAQKQTALHDRITYDFGTSRNESQVYLRITPNESGENRYEMHLNGNAFMLNQFVWP